MKQISDNSFRFLSKQQPWNYTSAVAARMKKYEPTHAVSGICRFFFFFFPWLAPNPILTGVVMLVAK